jgi:hypothetical protein
MLDCCKPSRLVGSLSSRVASTPLASIRADLCTDHLMLHPLELQFKRPTTNKNGIS